MAALLLAIETATRTASAALLRGDEPVAEVHGDAGFQALALTSMVPQRVDCMGASAAFALGFDAKYCQPGPPCNPTATVPYYRSDTTFPWTDHALRPTMILAADTEMI